MVVKYHGMMKDDLVEHRTHEASSGAQCTNHPADSMCHKLIVNEGDICGVKTDVLKFAAKCIVSHLLELFFHYLAFCRLQTLRKRSS